MEIKKEGDIFKIKKIEEKEMDKKRLVAMYIQLMLQKKDFEKQLSEIESGLNELNKYMDDNDLDFISKRINGPFVTKKGEGLTCKI